VCLSSQAGCAVGCTFCVTGFFGAGRNIAPSEMLGQFFVIQHEKQIPAEQMNVVFMGMGEPLLNFDHLVTTLDILYRNLAPRRITVSTSGVVPAMDRMIAELPQVNLAISLHAATDALRDELVPINRKWPVTEVVAAGRRFAVRTGRRVSLEYVMIDGMNDTVEQAARLAELARGWRSHVNLIPLNPTPGSRWSGTPPAAIDRFVAVLRSGGVPITVRHTRGREIEAACGQLHAQLAGRELRQARVAATTPAVTA
jgi:23S rRNA (adenine2503-C2)-methyltransferase